MTPYYDEDGITIYHGEMVSEPTYTKARPVVAEGARVGFITCLYCGVAILLDPYDEFDPRIIHNMWHAEVGQE